MTIETGGNGLIHLDRLQEAVKEAKTTYHKEVTSINLKTDNILKLESIRNVRKDRIPIGFSTPEIWKTSLQVPSISDIMMMSILERIAFY